MKWTQMDSRSKRRVDIGFGCLMGLLTSIAFSVWTTIPKPLLAVMAGCFMGGIVVAIFARPSPSRRQIGQAVLVGIALELSAIIGVLIL